MKVDSKDGQLLLFCQSIWAFEKVLNQSKKSFQSTQIKVHTKELLKIRRIKKAILSRTAFESGRALVNIRLR